jgi:hypothetical protein
MKKTLSLLALCTFAAALNAADIVIKPKSDARATVNVAHDNSDTLVLDSSSFSKYTVGNGVTSTFAAVRAISGENAGNADFAIGTLVIDANTAATNYQGASAANWAMNYFTLNFRNTNASAATASVNLDFSNLTVASTATAAVQKQYVNFKDSTTYNLNADKVYLGWNGAQYASNLSYITIDSGTKVNWSGSEFLIRQNGIMTVNGEFVRTGDGKVHLNAAGAVLNINDGAKFGSTIAGKFIMESGTTMNIGTNCTITFVGGDQLTLNGTINSKSALSFKLLTTAGTLNQTAGGVTFTRSSTFNSGANWTVYDKVVLEGSDATEARMAKLIVNDGAAITITQANGRVIFRGNNDLILNTANAIKKTNDAGVTLVTYSGKTNNNVHIYADQLFDRVYVNNSDLSMYLYNGAVVRFTPAQFDSFSANNAYLKIFNFEEDSIYFDYTESIAAAVNNYVKLYSGETEETFLGMGILGTDGWVTLVVPEPATYAAFFGLLALGFAAYRRRK